MGCRQYKKASRADAGAGEREGYIAGELELFYELALNGIGGNTIHEVKNTLSMLEVNQWAEYRNRRGSLNVGRRVEQTIGSMSAIFINRELAREDHIEPLLLMPHEDDVEEAFEMQIE